MAVQTNAQSQGAAVSNTVLPNNAFVPSVQEVPANSVLQTMLPPSNVSTSSRPQLQQVRLVKAVSSSTANTLPRQHQIVRIIKQSNDMNTVPNANVINVRPPSSSPMKGGVATFFNLPVSGSTKVLPHGTKLKVGDTITIPKLNLEQDKETTDLSAGQPLVASTPTKLVRVDGSASQSPAFLNRVTAPNNLSSAPQIATVIQANTSFAQVASPDRLSTISPSWAQSPLRYKRPSVFNDTTQGSETKRRRTPTTEKGSKGLRHFAMLVCEKVKQKVTTTYNEVADELVTEYSDSQRHLSEQQCYDQKNIRRRVYDALNVLMAMDIIYKDKKDIHWVGLPTNSAQEVQSLQAEKKKREQRIQQKTLQLQELILQQIAFKNLVQRNKRLQQTQGPPPENSSIQLPFIIVNTSKKTVIDCSISNDKYEYMFNFDNTFEIHDDIEVLKRMGMAYGLEAGTCSKENLKTAQTLVPPVLKPYLEQMAGHSKTSTNDDGTSTLRYTIQDAPRIVSNNGSTKDTNTFTAPPDKQGYNPVKVEPDVLDLGSCFSIGQVLDANDQEVAMVTDGSQISSSSSGITTGFTSSSRSSSSGLHSAVLSLTPMSSSGGSESRGSTPMGLQDS